MPGYTNELRFGIGGGLMDDGELWTGFKYIKAREDDKEFVRKHKDCPVEFSETDHYIRMFVNNNWVTINGITRNDYYEIVKSRF